MKTVTNNGGGPEPHQGSNPGAQSDPGPKEVGFYDQTDSHVLGDDGIQSDGFFAGVKDKVEDVFDVDLDRDGSVGNSREPHLGDGDERSVMRADGVSRTDTQQRELVEA